MAADQLHLSLSRMREACKIDRLDFGIRGNAVFLGATVDVLGEILQVGVCFDTPHPALSHAGEGCCASRWMVWF